MKSKLNIGTISLPQDFVTQTVAILARKRVGKTYTASVIAEEMIEAKLPFVVLDPTGAWWGLRSSADGRREGYPVVVIGGAHGDVPLEEGSGKVIADMVIENPGWYIVDLSATESDAEQDRWATDFATRFYRRKEQSRFPMHLFVDEADCFAPQRPLPGQLRMLGAFEAIVRRGGIRGIGVTLITQRPAVLNKNVLCMSEVLMVLQMSAPQDQDAVEEWIRRNGTKAERDSLMDSLASLQRGQAWIWSPSWLRCFECVKIRTRRTFNSSATPEAGENAVVPTKLAAVDLAALGERIQSAVQRAKDSDPELLRRRVKEAERATFELRKTHSATLEKLATLAAKKEKPAVTEAQLKRIEALADKLTAALGALRLDRKQAIQGLERVMRSSVKEQVEVIAKVLTAPPKPKPPVSLDDDLEQLEKPLLKAQRDMLRVLKQSHPHLLTKLQLALMIGKKVSGGYFGDMLSNLKRRALITSNGDLVGLTTDGLEEAGEVPPMPTGSELTRFWVDHPRLIRAEREMLRVLVENGPLSADELASQVFKPNGQPMEPTGGYFGDCLSKLRGLGLVNGDRQQLRAWEALERP